MKRKLQDAFEEVAKMSIGLGILGFAHGHVNMYCAKWREMPEPEIHLLAGWDHDSARAQQAHKGIGVEIHPSVEELLGRPDIDAVVIAAETSLHADLAEAAAAAGKTIVMQKPLALTMEQADRIVDAVRSANVPFTMAWQMRVDPQNIRMKQLIEDGTLGRIVMVRRRHGLATHVWPNFEDLWHAKPELNRGMWADDAAHPVDFLLWLLGEPESVMAEIDTLLNPKIPDDQGVAIFRYDDGTFAIVCSSFTCIAGENTTEIVGEKGVAIQNYGDGPSAGAPRPEGAPGLKWLVHGESEWVVSDIPSPPGQGVRIAALAEPILEFLQGKRPAIATAEEGRTALKMTLACHDSSEQGRRIRLK